MNTIREIQQNNEKELQLNIAGTNSSWHEQYKNSPWIYIGNLHTILTEGDIICLLSQYGEIEDIHLLRHNDTGISKGYAFVKYNDPRSCILAIDNFIGILICDKSVRIDHVTNYRVPKSTLSNNTTTTNKDDDNYYQNNDTKNNHETLLERTAPGHAYIGIELANEYTLQNGVDLFATKNQSSLLSGKVIAKTSTSTLAAAPTESSSSDDDDDDNNNNSDSNSSKDNNNDESNNLPQQQQSASNRNGNNNDDNDNDSRKKRKLERQQKRQEKLLRQKLREEKKLRKQLKQKKQHKEKKYKSQKKKT